MGRRSKTSVAVFGTVALLGVALGTGARDGETPAALEARVLAETIESHERRLAIDPNNPVIGAALINDRMAAFQLDNDIEHLQRAVALSERLVPTTINRANAQARVAATRLSLHDFRGAIKAARDAVSADSTNGIALGTLYDAALATGTYEEAEWALERLTRSQPGTLSTRLREARWLVAHGAADEAYDRLRPACLRLRARAVRRQLMAWCDTVLGGIAAAGGDSEREVALYERALATQPDYFPALEGLASVAYSDSDWGRARDLYERVLTEAHPDLFLRLAEIQRVLGDPESAARNEARFERLVSDPQAEAFQAHEFALYLTSQPDRLDEALAVIARDVAARRSVESLEVLAWVHLARGEYTEALAASTAARAWGVPGPTSDHTRARILIGLDRRTEAAALWPPDSDRAGLDPHARWAGG